MNENNIDRSYWKTSSMGRQTPGSLQYPPNCWKPVQGLAQPLSDLTTRRPGTTQMHTEPHKSLLGTQPELFWPFLIVLHLAKSSRGLQGWGPAAVGRPGLGSRRGKLWDEAPAGRQASHKNVASPTSAQFPTSYLRAVKTSQEPNLRTPEHPSRITNPTDCKTLLSLSERGLQMKHEP